MNDAPSPRNRPDPQAWPLSATLIASLAVAATVGVAMVVYVLAVAGGEIRGRLIAVLPIYFIAAFFSVLVAFWGLYAVVAWFRTETGGGMGAREHGIVALATFLVVSLIHYAQGPAVQRLLEEQDQPLAATFAALMRDPDPRARAALATRPDLPEPLLERLAGDRAAEVRAAAAASPRLSDESFNRLALDRDERVRLAVARNRRAPPTALDLLAAGPSSEVRELVAAHPNASEPVLQRLLGRQDRAADIAAGRLRGGKVP